jgi:hypothetical protein
VGTRFILNAQGRLAGGAFAVAVLIAVFKAADHVLHPILYRIIHLYKLSVFRTASVDVARQHTEDHQRDQQQVDQNYDKMRHAVEHKEIDYINDKHCSYKKLVERIHAVSALHEHLKPLQKIHHSQVILK